MSYQILGASLSVVEVPAALGKTAQQHFDEALVPGDCHGEEAFLQAWKRTDFSLPLAMAPAAILLQQPSSLKSDASHSGVLTLHRQVHPASPFPCQLGATVLHLSSHQGGRDVACSPGAPLHPQSRTVAAVHPDSIPAAHQLGVDISNGFPMHSFKQLLQLHQ